jgi:uncharacterized protein (DUF433 family)
LPSPDNNEIHVLKRVNVNSNLKMYYFCTMKTYNKIIKISSVKRFGRPCIRNTRIAVFDILGWLGSGMSFEEIINDYPELSREDIKASLMFAADRERKLQTI